MATYKQRAPYHRHTVSSRLSDDDDGANPSSSHASYVSASHLTQHTSFHQSQHHGQHPQAHSQAYTTDDDFFDSASNLEWTSSRHSTSARAKARQQQYLDQQLQRTREWQSVLAQHRQTASQLPVLNTAPASGPAVVVQVATPLSATLPPTLPSTTETATIESKGSNVSAGPAVSSDEFEDDLLASSDLPSGLASPRTADFGTPGLGTSSHAEHLSTFGFSDLTSDGGMESVDESEDLGVWSHEDEDEDGPSPYTPSFRRLSAISLSSSTSSPLVLSSATASLSHLPRPSFALATASASPYTGVDLTKFQNQMPFHDGSGNFGVAGRRGMGAMSSVMDESEYFDSDSSRASSVLRAYRPGTPLLLRRRISSSEFQNVIRNIAELQQANDRQQFERYTIEMQQPPPQRPHFIYPQIVPRRPIFNIYESEMEDLEEMVDDEVPAKIGWLQAFEQTLRALHPNEYAVHVTDPTVINPIKALAYHYSREESSLPHKDTKQLTRSTDATIPSSSSSSSSSSSPSSDSDARTSKESPEAKGKGRGQEKTKAEEEEDIKASCRVEQIRQNMSSASLQSLQRLQERKRSSPDQSPGHQDLHPGHGRLNRSDPMQVDFCPTIQHPPSPALVGMTRKECRVLSKSTGTSTSHR
ncbi:hypothetical protein BGW38_000426 [Lunasporangiospora selenospora]|uniref:Uncharacterized protein n=1 Tax=Lunasporangiospora selenospora TaxID=979761 RepID=A0A9P6FUW5_9FUNG|nr:hypothetical protein BGW38_000426 [Lunasporangiospora selenospora]